MKFNWRAGWIQGSIAIAALLVLFMFNRCGNNSDTIEPSFTSIYTNYLEGCGDCHAEGKDFYNNNEIDFTTKAKAYTSLTGALISTEANCSGLKLVTAGQPSQSMLLAIIDESVYQSYKDSTNCQVTFVDTHGGVGTTPVPSTAVLKAIQDWITAGAAND